MKKIYWLLFVVLLIGCTSETAKKTIEEYNQVFERVTTLEQVFNQTDWSSISGSTFVEIYNIGKELYYDYNPMDLKPEQVTACEALKERVNRLRSEISEKARQIIDNEEQIFTSIASLWEIAIKQSIGKLDLEYCR